MRAMRKKLNIFMLYLPIHYILEEEILTGANADIARTKREKEIVFVAERWMQSLLLRLKSGSVRKASRHADFMGFFFYSLCGWTKWARWVNLKFFLSLSDFNQVEWGEMSPRFPFATPGVWELPLRPTSGDVA